jgi:hypothetical protein
VFCIFNGLIFWWRHSGRSVPGLERWTCVMDWSVGLVLWTGALNLCYGLKCWTCAMDWSVGLVLWTGVLDLCYGLELWTCVMDWSVGLVLWTGVLDLCYLFQQTRWRRHSGAETCRRWNHEMYFMTCIVLYCILLNAFVSLIYWLQETVIIRNTKFAAATVYKLCFIYSSSTVYSTLAQQAGMPPWHWSCQ